MRNQSRHEHLPAARHLTGGGLSSLLLTLGVALTGPIAVAQDEPAGQLQDLTGTRTALESWVETRRVISKERRDWTLGKEVLGDRIELVQREIESLRTKVGEAEASISEADEKLAELIAQQERLKSASASLDQTVLALEARCRELLARLPDPILERCGPLRQRLPRADTEELKQSLSERFLTIAGILNEVTKFHREITVSSEVRELAGGESAEVDTLYVGISYGYYCTVDGRAAGIGSATADGWVWKPADQHAAAIAQAVKIVKNEAVAGFVPLPVELAR